MVRTWPCYGNDPLPGVWTVYWYVSGLDSRNLFEFPNGGMEDGGECKLYCGQRKALWGVKAGTNCGLIHDRLESRLNLLWAVEGAVWC
ncbi:hypothetical protein Bpfe_019788 [Biomphalaria pfeifferi]|uniref:Uncharacterized protein n=1 Tax=Biomphalaria pfeifferi TaxID=112525 RepID=A0AAD8F3Z0_BIOPF|nr:hypothetical protein Bpfe_019788 [Biomphalaria pfeifferi]